MPHFVEFSLQLVDLPQNSSESSYFCIRYGHCCTGSRGLIDGTCLGLRSELMADYVSMDFLKTVVLSDLESTWEMLDIRSPLDSELRPSTARSAALARPNSLDQAQGVPGQKKQHLQRARSKHWYGHVHARARMLNGHRDLRTARSAGAGARCESRIGKGRADCREWRREE